MKKISIILFSVAICAVTIFLILGNSSEVIFYPENVKYDLERDNMGDQTFSFNMNVISSKKNVDIEFVDAIGENVEHLAVDFKIDSFEDFKNKKIDGQYLIMLGVYCTSISDYIKIEALNLLVDGEPVTIEFEFPIENTFVETSETIALSVRSLPNYISTTSFVGQNETDYTFTVQAIKDCTVNSFSFNNFLEFDDISIYVNGERLNDFPIELKKDDILKITSKITLSDELSSIFDNFYVNFSYDYTMDDETYTQSFPISAIFIGNFEDAQAFVEEYKE